MTLGNRVENRRKEMKLTQEELAEKTELSQGYISQLEKSRFDPTAPVIVRLAVALEVSADELLGINDIK